jgi:hypothetical protein
MLKAIYSHAGNYLFPCWEHFIPMLGTTCLMAVFFHPAPLASTPPLKGWGAERANDSSGVRRRGGAVVREQYYDPAS